MCLPCFSRSLYVSPTTFSIIRFFTFLIGLPATQHISLDRQREGALMSSPLTSAKLAVVTRKRAQGPHKRMRAVVVFHRDHGPVCGEVEGVRVPPEDGRVGRDIVVPHNAVESDSPTLISCRWSAGPKARTF